MAAVPSNRTNPFLISGSFRDVAFFPVPAPRAIKQRPGGLNARFPAQNTYSRNDALAYHPWHAFPVRDLCGQLPALPDRADGWEAIAARSRGICSRVDGVSGFLSDPPSSGL